MVLLLLLVALLLPRAPSISRAPKRKRAHGYCVIVNCDNIFPACWRAHARACIAPCVLRELRARDVRVVYRRVGTLRECAWECEHFARIL